MQKPEVIVICDVFCLSKPALEAQLNQLSGQVPGFVFRYAENSELKQLMQLHQLKIVPCLCIGKQVLYGVPSPAEILKAWQAL